MSLSVWGKLASLEVRGWSRGWSHVIMTSAQRGAGCVVTAATGQAGFDCADVGLGT